MKAPKPEYIKKIEEKLNASSAFNETAKFDDDYANASKAAAVLALNDTPMSNHTLHKRNHTQAGKGHNHTHNGTAHNHTHNATGHNHTHDGQY
jgi:hypothetical protein